MDIINLTRELGKAIQKDEKYLKYKIASQNNDEDEGLQGLIGEFNLKRINLNEEIQKGETDEKKVEILNKEIREIYKNIMQNENMQAYNETKQEFEALIKRINSIILQCANGENPETADLTEGCGGSCSSCSGCK